MLKEPSAKNVGGHFREDTTLLLALLAIGIIVFFSRTFPTSNTSVASVA